MSDVFRKIIKSRAHVNTKRRVTRKRRQQQGDKDKKDFTREVPDEILWHIFQYVGTLWSVRCGSRVSEAWARVVCNHCLCIDEPSVSLEAYELRRIPNLRILKKWPFATTRNEGLSSLTALTTLYMSDIPSADSKYVLTRLQSLVNLTAMGAHHIVPAMMTNLRSLDLSYNRMVTSETIAALTGLRELKLIVCDNVKAECVSTLTNLRSLAVLCYGMTDVTLWQLTNLTSLKLAWTNYVTNRALARLTQLSNLTLTMSCNSVTVDDLLGLHLLTRLVVDVTTDNRDYTALTTLVCLELHGIRSHPQIPLHEQNYHLMTSLVTLRCNDDLCLSPEWIKKVPRLRELSAGVVTMAPQLVRADLAQFTRLEGSKKRGGCRYCLLK